MTIDVVVPQVKAAALAPTETRASTASAMLGRSRIHGPPSNARCTTNRTQAAMIMTAATSCTGCREKSQRVDAKPGAANEEPGMSANRPTPARVRTSHRAMASSAVGLRMTEV